MSGVHHLHRHDRGQKLADKLGAMAANMTALLADADNEHFYLEVEPEDAFDFATILTEAAEALRAPHSVSA